jgi:hypothetical protein
VRCKGGSARLKFREDDTYLVPHAIQPDPLMGRMPGNIQKISVNSKRYHPTKSFPYNESPRFTRKIKDHHIQTASAPGLSKVEVSY